MIDQSDRSFSTSTFERDLLGHNKDKNNKNNNNNQNELSEDEIIKAQLSARESAAIVRVRILVLLVLILVADAVSVLVYFVTSNAETDEFETQYDNAAGRIINTFDNVLNRIGSIGSIATAATVHGLDNHKSTTSSTTTTSTTTAINNNNNNNDKWPFHTLPSFQQRSATARLLSGALYITLDPIVADINRNDWEVYAAANEKLWTEEISSSTSTTPAVTRKPIFYFNSRNQMTIDPGPGPYLPSWETSPVMKMNSPMNENLFRRKDIAHDLRQCLQRRITVVGSFECIPGRPIIIKGTETTSPYALSIQRMGPPFADIYIPVFDTFEKSNRTVVGVISASIHWKSYFYNLLSDNSKHNDGDSGSITVVLYNSCDNAAFTLGINGPEVNLIGYGDYHDPTFDDYVHTSSFQDVDTILDASKMGLQFDNAACSYSIHVYPSMSFYNVYNTSTPLIMTGGVAAIFLLTMIMFLFYNRLVEWRQKVVLKKAAVSTAIVTSLFPEQIQDILKEDNNGQKGDKKTTGAGGNELKSFLAGSADGKGVVKAQISQKFPHCTVYCADIAGFTKWSANRDPEQVFVLLQTLYSNFDQIAKKRKVFKVETIGDCYLAVTGLPAAQPNHALIMARFAWECKQRMKKMVKELTTTLGQDTATLSMRTGIHSGPVTAGVLKGDRSRFQLFGETVRTVGEMEATGMKDKIQLSQTTANLLIMAGKEHWVKSRTDIPERKGHMKTYWLIPGSKQDVADKEESKEVPKNNTSSRLPKRLSLNSASSETNKSDATLLSSENDENRAEEESYIDDNLFEDVWQEHLVDWMVDLLSEQLKKVIANRPNRGFKGRKTTIAYFPTRGTIPLDEVGEMIPMSSFVVESRASGSWGDLGEDLVSELRHFVTLVANMYQMNPFHNFEHACHATMATSKFMKHILTADRHEDDLYVDCLCSDHLLGFAVVFSALVHDIDHRGCSNAQLINEEPRLGQRYRYKSVAEQNSLDIAWNLFMDQRFDRLRNAIFDSEEELFHFRQIAVNAVLATDIFDKELNDLRKLRWRKAFSEIGDRDYDAAETKATVVMEHIMQASDVAHTMQNWHVYCKWNKLLFKEMYLAYRNGRMAVDPSTFWYKGELGFFDNYVIPLARKLRDGYVFGESSEEYLNYALSNRAEWATRGEGMVQEFMNKAANECR